MSITGRIEKLEREAQKFEQAIKGLFPNHRFRILFIKAGCKNVCNCPNHPCTEEITEEAGALISFEEPCETCSSYTGAR